MVSVFGRAGRWAGGAADRSILVVGGVLAVELTVGHVGLDLAGVRGVDPAVGAGAGHFGGRRHPDADRALADAADRERRGAGRAPAERVGRILGAAAVAAAGGVGELR